MEASVQRFLGWFTFLMVAVWGHAPAAFAIPSDCGIEPYAMATESSSAMYCYSGCVYGYPDADYDGYGDMYGYYGYYCLDYMSVAYDTTDCDDYDYSIHPGAAEVCDSVDNDCDSTVDEGVKSTFYRDVDGDGYGGTTKTTGCSAPTGYVATGGDCNDSSSAIKPGAAETCNSTDDDCDGSVDEGLTTYTYYRDADGDGYGTTSTTSSCSTTAPSGYAKNSGDCNDSSTAVNPGQSEICNGTDDDCDGNTDEGVKSTFYKDADGDGYGGSVTTTACSAPTGYKSTSGDCNDSNATIYPSAPELCDSLDNDCDSSADEGLTFTTYYRDADGDGYGISSTISSCETSAPSGYASASGDCNDSSASIRPGAAESCNSTDDDCDGSIDEGLTLYTYYVDSDKDTYGTSTTTTTCATSAPTGYATRSGDCNDGNSAINPGATEVCNSADDDCDGNTDEGVKGTFYADSDKDGYGNASVSTTACTAPSGYVSNATDCDDTRATVKPGGTETCNGLDDDCDGNTDEGVKTTYYRDADSDGYGTSAVTRAECSAPSGYVANATDCDDSTSSVNPGKTETCNGVDDNCSGAIDEGVKTTYYRDADSDGYGRSGSTQQACSAPSGYVLDATDCDDTRATVNPAGTEVCNELDDDCDGTVDDGVTTTFYRDADGDTYGSATVTTAACSVPSGYVSDKTDCNDGSASIYPSAPEICDAADNDCDGSVDEVPPTWYVDGDGDGYGSTASTVTDCAQPTGYVSNSTDCDDSSSSIRPGGTETCNSVDDDCDGVVDDEATDATTYYADADGDGYGGATSTTRSCTGAPTGYVATATDCDDTRALVYPGADEICNELDDDCDGVVDDSPSDATTWYVDADADGYGVTSTAVVSCDAPGSGYATSGGDCADSDATRSPGALEVADGVDQNCNGLVDDGTTVYDDDGDGYTEEGGDCDDTTVEVRPGLDEVCDGADQNCNGVVDEATECYDDDGDGWMEIEGDCDDGTPEVAPDLEEVPDNGVDDDCDDVVDEDPNVDDDGDGYTEAGGDCAPFDEDTYPGAPELADGVDNDCDEVVDEGTAGYDDDGDGYSEDAGDCDDGDDGVGPEAVETADGVDEDCDGTVDEGTVAYDDDGDGFTEQGGDCDDDDPQVNPDAAEVGGNDADDDCDGTTDEAPVVDADGDGFASGDDCDDDDPLTYPFAYETCDGVDNDCDGTVDQACADGGADPGCGCATGAAGGGLPAALALLALLRRSRRRDG